MKPDKHVTKRLKMVKNQIFLSGINDPKIVAAMEAVPRHLFIPKVMRFMAYSDGPVPIGKGQTISQPYVVAFMTRALEPQSSDRVLEIGCGSGYQAAVLSHIVKEVFSVEIIGPLATRTRERLQELQYNNVHVIQGDGSFGLRGYAPFDKIIVTAAPATFPYLLADQLKMHGIMVLPLGPRYSVQKLLKYIKVPDSSASGYKLESNTLTHVQFVPMTGAIAPANPRDA